MRPLSLLAVLAMLVPPSFMIQTLRAVPAFAAPTSTLKLAVVSARDEAHHQDSAGNDIGAVAKGAAVSSYKWVINVDDTGNPTQARTPGCMPNDGGNPQTDLTNYYPRGCDWPSVHNFSGGSAQIGSIVAQGTDADLNTSIGLDLSVYPPGTKFLISVTADGYRIDGTHFSLPLDDTAPVTVGMQPYPLPLGTLQIQVFEDSSTNGQFDPQVEHGLQGFVGHINDVLAEVTTNWFGDPLCTEYDTNHNPIPGTGGRCASGADGVIKIPDLGPNRYSVQVIAPDGQSWVQTTTLEGAKDWDTWVQEGYNGLDTELLVDGNPTPVAFFGYVPKLLDWGAPQDATHNGIAPGTGHIKGRVISSKSYLPPAGGDTLEGPVPRPWVAITDLNLNTDPLVYVDRWNADGTFDVGSVPPSTYQVSFWDDRLDLLLGVTTVVVADGQTVDIGDFSLSHWFSEVHGTVFIDNNEDGKQQTGEPGLAGFPVQMLSRENSIVDAGSSVVTTDANGHYSFTELYPYGYWTVEQVYDDRFFTTGVTYQADNQPTETTQLTAQVDVAMLNQDGLNARLDWGLKAYPPGANGGIVGTVYYNETRNELDARLSATEDYEAGIPGLDVNLYATVKNPDGTLVKNPDGSYKHGPLLNTYVTETFTRPTDCQARDAEGNPMTLAFAPPATGGFECIESPLMGNQVGVDAPQVNGNYGFATRLADKLTGAPVAETPLEPDTYLVEVQVPDDAYGKPKLQVSREEDINVFSGDQFVPQVPPPPCAGALHTVDVAGIAPDGPNAVENPSFVDAGGSPYEGQAKPLCDTKLVTLNDRKSIAPTFDYFTDVPLPGRLFGAVVEDLALGTNPDEFYYGEKAGIPNAPIGVYDYSGRLVFNDQADPNGFFEMLLPSTSSYNCPLPAGPCPGMYRLVGNDPGQPGHPNPGYDPQYRTLASSWQVWPNLTLLADVALLPTAPVIEIPGTQRPHPPQCPVGSTVPQLFAVSQPYVDGDGSFTIDGQGFGDPQGTGTVTLGGTALTVNSWSDRHVDVTVPPGTSFGAHQLVVTNDSGNATVDGLTFHVLGGSYTPTLREVGPGKSYSTIQSALEVAASSTADGDLVVVYPNTPGAFAPLGDYYENIVIHSPVKLQGVGPGGVRADGTFVKGSIINALGYGAVPARSQAWHGLVEGLRTTDPWAGNQNPSDSEAVYVLAGLNEFTSSFKAAIDGFSITGGDQAGPPNPANTIFYPTQGGGIFVNAYANYLQVTNNVIQGNGGAYGGAIRVGTPNVGDNHNDNLRIAHNRIVGNGGSNLAGAVGLFAGTNGYEVDHNDICGNFSAEYGGGISHFGLSGGGATINEIHHNRIYLNESYDEGAGVMIAGELSGNPAQLSPGSGPVDIYNNVVQSNLSNDDGGGLRFLMAGNTPINVYNNMIVNNVATHEGGGVAVDDTPDVRFYNNTVAKNVTTATSIASAGNPAPAGLSTVTNSDLLQASLPDGSPTFSDPLQFNNIFWDNRAGSWNGSAVTGIGLPGDATPVNQWDMGAIDGSGPLTPTNSVLTDDPNSNITGDPSNTVGIDPGFVSPFDTVMRFLPWRGGANIVFAYLVTADVPPEGAGNYHLTDFTSPAFMLGQPSKDGTNAPTNDIDNELRNTAAPTAGADEIVAHSDLSVANVSSFTPPAGKTGLRRGSAMQNIITASNAGPDAVTAAPVTDTASPQLTGVAWCPLPASGTTCSSPAVSGDLSTTVSLTVGQTARYKVTGTVSSTATGNIINTATVSAPAGWTDPVTANNTATTTDAVVLVADLGIAGSVTYTPNAAHASLPGATSSPTRSGRVDYVLTVSNTAATSDAVLGAAVTNTAPSQLTGVNWCALPAAGSVCSGPTTSGNLNTTANLAQGATVRYLVWGTVGTTAVGNLVNNATVAVPAGWTDPVATNDTWQHTVAMLLGSNLSVTKTDTKTMVRRGEANSYTLTVTNAGPDAVTNASVSDIAPTKLTGVAWCPLPATGTTCSSGPFAGNLSTTVTLAVSGTARYLVSGTVSSTAALGTLVNSATVTVPAGWIDPSTANNTGTDTDALLPSLTEVPVLDTFDRANATNLNINFPIVGLTGTNWAQTLTGANASIQINSNQAISVLTTGTTTSALWGTTATPHTFGTRQGASAYLVNPATYTNPALILKARGGTDTAPLLYLRVRYCTAVAADCTTATSVVVEYTANSGVSFTTVSTFAAAFVATNTLNAVANTDGSVDVWRTAVSNNNATNTYLGHTSPLVAFSGAGATGRIGINLPTTTSRIDNFSGGNVT